VKVSQPVVLKLNLFYSKILNAGVVGNVLFGL